MIVPSGWLSCHIMFETLERRRRDRRLPLHRNDNNFNHAPIEVDDGSTEPADNRLVVWKEIL